MRWRSVPFLSLNTSRCLCAGRDYVFFMQGLELHRLSLRTYEFSFLRKFSKPVVSMHYWNGFVIVFVGMHVYKVSESSGARVAWAGPLQPPLHYRDTYCYSHSGSILFLLKYDNFNPINIISLPVQRAANGLITSQRNEDETITEQFIRGDDLEQHPIEEAVFEPEGPLNGWIAHKRWEVFFSRQTRGQWRMEHLDKLIISYRGDSVHSLGSIVALYSGDKHGDLIASYGSKNDLLLLDLSEERRKKRAKLTLYGPMKHLFPPEIREIILRYV